MSQGKKDASQRRTRRLGAALRENLKRRKAQVRARQAGTGAAHETAGIAPDKPKV
jgi:hypothetical protein